MPTYTVVGLVDDRTGDLYVASVFAGQQINADRVRYTWVDGTNLTRFLGYFIADDADTAEEMAREIVMWPYDSSDIYYASGRKVETVAVIRRFL